MMKKLGFLMVATLMLSFAFASLTLARAGPEKSKNVAVATQAVVVRDSFALDVHSMPVVFGDKLSTNRCLTANVRGDEQYKHESISIQDGGGGNFYQRSAPGIVLRL